MMDLGPHRYSKEKYIDGIIAGDRVVLSRAITLIESSKDTDQPLAEEVLNACIPYTGNAYRVGITGAPGVGKSTFINRLGETLLQHEHKIAVLAVDPTSIRTKGSILGDKTRMSTLSKHADVYIRPSPTRGILGGVANRTREVVMLCEAAGFDFILIETVGVGQSEVIVREMVDLFLLLLLPHAGDDIQGMKKGIMEMADSIIIHKADGDMLPAARLAQAQYRQAVKLNAIQESNWDVPVMACSSLTGEGMEVVWDNLQMFRKQMVESGRWKDRRDQQAEYWFEQYLHEAFMEWLEKDENLTQVREKYRMEIMNKIQSPRTAARKVIQQWAR